MYERFTERSRQAVVLAMESARGLGQEKIDSGHLLIGLLREENGLAARALANLSVRLEDVESLMDAGPIAHGGHLPFTSDAKQSLELALREALSLGHNYIGTEHILLGLVREDRGPSSLILRQMAIEPETVRAEVVRLLVGSKKKTPPAPSERQRLDAALTALHEITLRPKLALSLAHRALAADAEVDID